MGLKMLAPTGVGKTLTVRRQGALLAPGWSIVPAASLLRAPWIARVIGLAKSQAALTRENFPAESKSASAMASTSMMVSGRSNMKCATAVMTLVAKLDSRSGEIRLFAAANRRIRETVPPGPGSAEFLPAPRKFACFL